MVTIPLDLFMDLNACSEKIRTISEYLTKSDYPSRSILAMICGIGIMDDEDA